MEYIEEYNRVLEGTNFIVKPRDQKNLPEIKFIDIIDPYDKIGGEEYQLTIQINEKTKTVYIYEVIYTDAYLQYIVDGDRSSILKNIINKTIEISKRANMEKILIPDNLHGLSQEFLVTRGFKYLYNEFFLRKGIKKINLKIIQMIIVKNLMIQYNQSSELDEAKDKIMEALFEIKPIYKSSKELKDFKKEMEKLGYWELIEKEITIYLQMDKINLPAVVTQPLDMMVLIV